MNLRTRSELFGLLLTVSKATAPQLVALARPLGISASNVKSHLSRLTAEGVVRRAGPPRRAIYSLTEQRRPMVEDIGVRLADPPDGPWNGEWLLLATPVPGQRAQRETLRAALWFDGFRPWGREVWLRPAWPLPWALKRAEAFVARGALCAQGPLVGTANLAGMRALYAVDALDRDAGRLAAAIARRSRSFQNDAQAFAARHRLAGQVIDVVARDPRLPLALSPGRGLTALRNSYRALMKASEARAGRFVATVMINER